MPKSVDKYELELTKVLDVHAPVRKRKITVRPSAAWYSDDIDREKRKRRKLERRWCKSNLVINRELYKSQWRVVRSLIRKAKENYCTSPMSCQKIRATKIRSCLSTTQILANRFVDFFHNKIKAIRSDLFARQTPATNPFMDTQACNTKLAEFESMTEDQVDWLFMSEDLCNLGPLPVSIMKDWMDLLLPVLTKMTNMSLETELLCQYNLRRP